MSESTGGRRDVDESSQVEAELSTDQDLEARIAELEATNRRLRKEYARAQRSKYHRTALGLAAIGILAGVGAVLFPHARSVLTILAATGLFAAVITEYLTPERFISATVGEHVYRPWAGHGDSLVSELGLTDDRLYVPVSGSTPHETVRLFIPLHTEYDIPATEELTPTFVVTRREAERGISVQPMGAPLLNEFAAASTGPLATDPTRLADELSEGLVEQFELVRGIEPEVRPEEGLAVFELSGNGFGDVNRFDHPISSFIASGFAKQLETPVELTVEPGDSAGEPRISLKWTPADADQPGGES